MSATITVHQPLVQPVQLTTKITKTQLLKLSGQALAVSEILIEVKKELLSAYHGNHQSLALTIEKCVEAWDATNSLLRALDYTESTDEQENGQVGTTTNE